MCVYVEVSVDPLGGENEDACLCNVDAFAEPPMWG